MIGNQFIEGKASLSMPDPPLRIAGAHPQGFKYASNSHCAVAMIIMMV